MADFKINLLWMESLSCHPSDMNCIKDMKLFLIPKLLMMVGVSWWLASCAAPETCMQVPDALSPRSWHVSVCSKCLWNETGIRVQKGDIYALKPSGAWADCFVRCDASGPTSSFLRTLMLPLRGPLRLPPGKDKRSHFLSLVVCVQAASGLPDELPDHTVLIPREGLAVWEAPADGRLLALANDWRSGYGNNRGVLDLHVTQLWPN